MLIFLLVALLAACGGEETGMDTPAGTDMPDAGVTDSIPGTAEITPTLGIDPTIDAGGTEVPPATNATVVNNNGDGENGNGDATSELNGTSWTLVSLEGESIVGDTDLTLMFDDGVAGGAGGCNQFGGVYEASGSDLTFSDIVSTLIACEDQDLMDQETAYLSALQEVTGYQMTDDDRLVLQDAAGNALLEFEAAANGTSNDNGDTGETETTTPEANVDDLERVTFAPGTTSAVLQGNLAPGGSQAYVLNIQADQWVEVVTSPVGAMRLTIAGEDGTVLRSGMGEGSFFRGMVPTTQDYIFRVSTGSEAVTYSMNVMVPERISFDPGSTSDTVQGSLAPFAAHHYVFSAQAGQEVFVDVSPPGMTRLTLFGVDGTVLASGMGEGSWFTGELPETQDYFLNLSAGEQAVDYELTLTIE